MRRKDKELTDRKEIEAIIERSLVCRIAICDGETPYMVPVNFGYRDNCLYIHSAPEGKKIELIRRNNYVCFEMEADIEVVRAESACRWSMRYASVIGFGRAHFIDNAEEKKKGLDIIVEHYSGSFCEIPDEGLKKVLLIKIAIESMSAKVSR